VVALIYVVVSINIMALILTIAVQHIQTKVLAMQLHDVFIQMKHIQNDYLNHCNTSINKITPLINENYYDIEGIEDRIMIINDNKTFIPESNKLILNYEQYIAEYHAGNDKAIKIIDTLVDIISNYHNTLKMLHNKLETLCPVHLPLDLADEWQNFIDVRFDASFGAVKNAIQSIQKIQEDSIEYVQYVLAILKGFKDKRAIQYEEMIGFYSKMRNSQESFAKYLSTVSQTFQYIKEILVQVEEITDKINILSLNMSIEANKLTGNNVFSVIAKELHIFSEQTIKHFEPIRKTIEQNLNVIEEKKKEEQDAIQQIQEFINLSENLINEYEKNIDQFTKLVDSVSKNLVKQDEDVKSNIFQQFEDLQKLVIIREQISHRDAFNKDIIDRVNNIIQQLIREHKICDGINCQYRIDSFKLLESLITTADEREFLNMLYKKYLNKTIEENGHKQGDVVLF
jgi:hypothetical protein